MAEGAYTPLLEEAEKMTSKVTSMESKMDGMADKIKSDIGADLRRDMEAMFEKWSQKMELMFKLGGSSSPTGPSYTPLLEEVEKMTSKVTSLESKMDGMADKIKSDIGADLRRDMEGMFEKSSQKMELMIKLRGSSPPTGPSELSDQRSGVNLKDARKMPMIQDLAQNVTAEEGLKVSLIKNMPECPKSDGTDSLGWYAKVGQSISGIKGLFSNRIDRESLKPGDHIYSWRSGYIYAHHGIYVGNDTVIHFTRRGREVGTGTVLDLIMVSSGEARYQLICPTCTPPEGGDAVVSSCLNCFLAGGILYRFEYAVSPALFIAQARGGTCTLAVSDPNDLVVHRAKYLLENGFGRYNVFKNNCEDFAIYCKTGLLVLDQSSIGKSGQAVSTVGGPLAAVLSTPLRLVTKNICGMAATSVGFYCAGRYAADIGMRRDKVKVSVEDLKDWQQ